MTLHPSPLSTSGVAGEKRAVRKTRRTDFGRRFFGMREPMKVWNGHGEGPTIRFIEPDPSVYQAFLDAVAVDEARMIACLGIPSVLATPSR